MKKLMLICTVLSAVALAGCVYRPYGYRDGYYGNRYYNGYNSGRYYGDRYDRRDYRDGYYSDRYRYRDRDYDRDDR